MRKIFCFNGSHRKDSFTGKIMKELCDNLAINNVFDDQIYWVDNFNSKIEMCDGCGNCFKKGKCKKDTLDSMKDIKKNILDANIIIIGTPVYLNNISSYTKIFIERLALFTHLMCLLGKIGIVVITTANSGYIETVNYINNVFKFMGVSTQGILIIKKNDYYFSKIDMITKHINLYKVKDYKKIISKDTIELFEKYKYIFNMKVTSPYEKKWWCNKEDYTIEMYIKFLKNYGNDELKT